MYCSTCQWDKTCLVFPQGGPWANIRSCHMRLLCRTGSAPPPSIPQYAALRHELVTALLAVVAQQPAASLAQSLCNEVALAAAHDRPPPSVMPPAASSSDSAAEGTAGSTNAHGPAAAAIVGSPQQAAVLAWLKMARMVLQTTSVRTALHVALPASLRISASLLYA